MPRNTSQPLWLLALAFTGLASACPKALPPPNGQICTGVLSVDTYSWKTADDCWADRSALTTGVLSFPCGGGEARLSAAAACRHFNR